MNLVERGQALSCLQATHQTDAPSRFETAATLWDHEIADLRSLLPVRAPFHKLEGFATRPPPPSLG